MDVKPVALDGDRVRMEPMTADHLDALVLAGGFEELWLLTAVKTNVLNQKSRNAMLRMGGTEEGVLRKNQLTQGGRYRDSIYYSVLDTEWPAVKERLRGFIARRPDESSDS